MPLLNKTKAHVDFAFMYLHIPKACSKHIHWKNTGDDFPINNTFYLEDKL